VSGRLSSFFPEEIRDPAKNNRKENNSSRIRRKSPIPIHVRIGNLRIGVRPHRCVTDRLVQIWTICFGLRPRRMHAQNQKPQDHQSKRHIVKAIHGLKYHIRRGSQESASLTPFLKPNGMPALCGSAKRTLVMFAMFARPGSGSISDYAINHDLTPCWASRCLRMYDAFTSIAGNLPGR
jgi:hypothetical protein